MSRARGPPIWFAVKIPPLSVSRFLPAGLASRLAARAPLPPAVPRLGLRAPAQVLAAHDEAVARLRARAALPQAEFGPRFVAPLLRLAGYVNVLPGTPAALFHGEMGLVRAALETALAAFEAAHERRFTTGEPQPEVEARWRYVCFLAGLLLPLGRTLTRVAVTAPDGQAWKRHLDGLGAWGAHVGTSEVVVHWRGVDGEPEMGPDSGTVIVLPLVVGADNLQFLEDACYDLVAALYRLAAGEEAKAQGALELVLGCWEQVAAREAGRLMKRRA